MQIPVDGLGQAASQFWALRRPILAGIHLIDIQCVLRGPMAKDFYSDALRRAGIAHDASILVVCGGPYDRQTFFEQAYGCYDFQSRSP
jgi:hypothetical protein